LAFIDMITPDEIIRSRRKTLSITVDSFGRLIVRAPYSCSEARIFAFLQEKENWILRKKTEMQGAGTQLPPENLHGYEMLLLGKRVKILLTDSARVEFRGEENCLLLPQKNARQRLIRWLKENAKRIFSAVTAQKSVQMNTTYKSVSVTSARGRWGSCSADNALHYSFRLIYAPKDVIEYVIVHELSHTLHKNHGKMFWAEVAKYAPDWKEKRAWLKTHGVLMEIF